MKISLIALLLLGVLPAAALAENGGATGPAAKDKAVTAPHPLEGENVVLSRKERRGLAYGRQWANNREQPARGPDGSVVFVFGSTLPTVVCAPLYVCDLVLEDGETVNDLHVGDAVRWNIAPATQGAADRGITHIIIKPSDIGLTTNLLITTNRRAYTIKLVSQQEAWMPRVAFQYPDGTQVQWGAYRNQMERQREDREAAADAEPPQRAEFTYQVSGDEPAWRPVRVFAAGGKTYIQFPRGIAHGDLPALVGLADDGGIFTESTHELVNYRYINGRFVVDKVLDRAALLSGTGGQQVKVKLEREGGKP